MRTPPDLHPSRRARLVDPLGRVRTSEIAQPLAGLQGAPAVHARVEARADQGTAGQLPADEREEWTVR
jgi:hypothetical protein